MSQTLKFTDLFQATIDTLKKNQERLLKTLLLPVAIIIVLDLAASVFPFLFVFSLQNFLTIFVQCVIAITIHRIILIGPHSVPETGIRSWSERETKFLLYSLGVGLMMFVVSLFMLIPLIGFIISFAACFIIILRFSLVFPAIATDKELDFKGSWEITKNWIELMFYAVILIPLIISIPMLLFVFLPFLNILGNLWTVVITVFMVASLSLAYEHINANS